MTSATLESVEPGFSAAVLATQLTHSPNRCLMASYLKPPISLDGWQLLHVEFEQPQVDRRKPDLVARWR